jgi:hypothetical protein
MAALGTTEEQRKLLRPREAADRLTISERQLWAQTDPRGPIPCVRIGKSVRYSPDAIQRFIDEQEQNCPEVRQ